SPNGSLSLERSYRPVGAQAVAPAGRAISYSHPPPARGRWAFPRAAVTFGAMAGQAHLTQAGCPSYLDQAIRRLLKW
ncbi:MAG: hypothetical protein ACYSOT_02475, partial [Planctomycetota bacterium]